MSIIVPVRHGSSPIVPFPQELTLRELEAQVSHCVQELLSRDSNGKLAQKDSAALGRELIGLTTQILPQLAIGGDELRPNILQLDLALSLIDKKQKVFSLQPKERQQLERYERAVHTRLFPDIQPEHLQQKENLNLLKKWTACGFPVDAFYLYPDIVDVVFSTHLHNAMRYYGHLMRFDEKTKELLIPIEGSYKDARALLRLLKMDGELVINKENPAEKWCYLDTGLCRRNQSQWTKLEPCATLTDAELKYAQDNAKLLPSTGAKADASKATCVVEVVSSWTKSDVNIWTGGFKETFEMPRHPWIRLITPDGKVRIVGFGWQHPVSIEQIAATVSGIFRSPDPWEAMNYQARPVTRIATTQNELDAIIKLVEDYQREGVAFNIFQHNCTRFVQHVLHTLGFEVNVEASWGEVAHRVMPIWMQNACTQLNRLLRPIKKAVKWLWHECTPPIVRKLADYALRKLSAMKNFLVLGLGGLKGKTLRRFQRNNLPSQPTRRQALIKGARDFFNERLVQPILPRKLIEWQMAQVSTSVYPSEVGFHGQYGRNVQTFPKQSEKIIELA